MGHNLSLVALLALLGLTLLRLGFDALVLAGFVLVAFAMLWKGRKSRQSTSRSEPLHKVSSSLSERSLDSLPDPILLIDEVLQIHQANRAAYSQFPHLKAGQALSLLFRAPDILASAQASLKDGMARTIAHEELKPVRKTFSVRFQRIEGARPHLLMLIQDVTEQRRVEEMRSDFVANASHELRTPLASMLGFIETLQGPARKDPKAQEKFLIIMRDQALRMKRLIDDLLSLSRIAAQEHLPLTQVVNLEDLAREVVGVLSALAQDHGVKIVLETDGPCFVRGQRDDLHRMIENLIDNAIKYGGNTIRVTLHRGNEISLNVSDNGPGIAPQHLPRLTERFYRVDSGSSQQRSGTGLGLAIVKHVATRHRAKLLIESKLGEGSCFRVVFTSGQAEP